MITGDIVWVSGSAATARASGLSFALASRRAAAFQRFRRRGAAASPVLDGVVGAVLPWPFPHATRSRAAQARGGKFRYRTVGKNRLDPVNGVLSFWRDLRAGYACLRARYLGVCRRDVLFHGADAESFGRSGRAGARRRCGWPPGEVISVLIAPARASASPAGTSWFASEPKISGMPPTSVVTIGMPGGNGFQHYDRASIQPVKEPLQRARSQMHRAPRIGSWNVTWLAMPSSAAIASYLARPSRWPTRLALTRKPSFGFAAGRWHSGGRRYL